jgi:phosphoribosyl 1,2-cyclic phosphate phosphodiesterase
MASTVGRNYESSGGGPVIMSKSLHMKLTFLGTGTSVGVPVIGCDCAVCRSDDPKNNRLRTSVFVQAGGVKLVVDTPPDFRQQVLRYGVDRVDAVLFTHSHADHMFGLDDIRRFNTMQGHTVIPAYAGKDVLPDLKRVFSYVLQAKPEGVFRPLIDFKELGAELNIGDVRITPLPVVHGSCQTLGFRFDCGGKSLGYVPDCHEIPEETLELLGGLDVMILDALRHKPHKTHLTVADSVELLKQIGAGRSYIVHMCHDLDHDETQARLPEGVYVSYDGLELEV